jgi:hypothetical protein
MRLRTAALIRIRLRDESGEHVVYPQQEMRIDWRHLNDGMEQQPALSQWYGELLARQKNELRKIADRKRRLEAHHAAFNLSTSRWNVELQTFKKSDEYRRLCGKEIRVQFAIDQLSEVTAALEKRYELLRSLGANLRDQYRRSEEPHTFEKEE